MSILVLGTGTGVGKTLVSAALLHRYAPRVAYLKPVSTGTERDALTVAELGPAEASIEPEIYSFAAPMSPHAAAPLEGRRLDPEHLRRVLWERLEARPLIVEGIGGVLVPLTAEGLRFADFIREFGLETVVVASSQLGTINHTLLTLEALRSRGISIAGVVLSGPRSPSNKEAIERFGGVAVVAELDALERLDRAAVAAASQQLGGAFDHCFSSAPAAENDWPRAPIFRPYTALKLAPPATPIARAEGAWLVTTDGRRILDGTSSWWVNIHGHAHPRLVRALADQGAQLEQVLFADFVHEPAAALAEALIARAPVGPGRVFFSDNGSTAVEVAIKIALQAYQHRGHRQRVRIAAVAHAYHGDTFGAMALGAGTVFHRAFQDLLMEVRTIAAPCCLAGACGQPRPPSAEELFADRGEEIAAVIYEPLVQGAGGMKIHPPEFYRDLEARARAAGALTIADEVFTGFGRTGALFACDRAGLRPDLMCLSKGLTGGMMPLGATLMTDALVADFASDDRGKMLFHGHSYSGNALACRLGLESLRIFEEEGALAKVSRLETWLRDGLARMAEHPKVSAVRGIGGLAVIELEGSGDYLDPIGPKLQAALLRRRIHLRPLGNVLYFLPPYCIEESEVRWVFDQLRQTLDAF
ncbi:MAG: adenosylmethionine--8-amino-7-oxononanoate transaminase [Myxococcota bacterium]